MGKAFSAVSCFMFASVQRTMPNAGGGLDLRPWSFLSLYPSIVLFTRHVLYIDEFAMIFRISSLASCAVVDGRISMVGWYSRWGPEMAQIAATDTQNFRLQSSRNATMQSYPVCPVFCPEVNPMHTS